MWQCPINIYWLCFFDSDILISAKYQDAQFGRCSNLENILVHFTDIINPHATMENFFNFSNLLIYAASFSLIEMLNSQLHELLKFFFPLKFSYLPSALFPSFSAIFLFFCFEFALQLTLILIIVFVCIAPDASSWILFLLISDGPQSNLSRRIQTSLLACFTEKRRDSR